MATYLGILQLRGHGFPRRQDLERYTRHSEKSLQVDGRGLSKIWCRDSDRQLEIGAAAMEDNLLGVRLTFLERLLDHVTEESPR